MGCKIVLLFAASAVLASCVKEAGLEPQELNPGQVVIKAVSADTKTLLDTDGTSVVWEENDAIKVVLAGSESSELQDFSATAINGNEADFTGEFETETRNEDGAKAYAVYPASAVSEGENVEIRHTLPNVQDGTIASGMNLSYAVLSMDDINSGSATANFKNALALLKVIVPEGVKKVSLTSSNETLVGDATFYDPLTNGVMSRRSVTGSEKTVTLYKDDDDLIGTHYLLVYPANTGNLTLKMEGTDGVTTYEKAISGIRFNASEYRTIDLTKIFNMPVPETRPISPMGETVEFEVIATEQYEYTVAIEGDPEWITLNENDYVTKALVGTTVSFEVKANMTGQSREADITISWNDGEDQSKTFKVTQESAYLDFVYVDGNPDNELIEWEETFGVYASEADYENYLKYLEEPETNKEYKDNLKIQWKNTFTIALSSSDEIQYGMYKIEGMFRTDSYRASNGQPVSGGGVYYADYDTETKQLTVKMANATKSYFFTSDVVLTYDDVEKTFSAPVLSFGANGLSSIYNGDGVIPDYEAHHYVDDEGPTGVEALYGEYIESFTEIQNMTPETTVISESDNPSYDVKIQFFYTEGDYLSYYDTAYGVVNAEGTELTVTYLSYSNFFAKPDPFVLTISDGTLSGTVGSVTDYTAVKKVPFDATALYGEYIESFTEIQNMTPETTVISESDNPSYDVKIQFFYTEGDYLSYYDTAYGVVNAEGTELTVTYLSYSNFFAKPDPFVLTISDGTLSGTVGSVSDYTATRQAN